MAMAVMSMVLAARLYVVHLADRFNQYFTDSLRLARIHG